MKAFVKILPVLALIIAFSSCNKNDISEKVAGEYILGDKDELVINEKAMKITDYPDARVKIESMGDNLISLKLQNILLFNKDCLLTGEVAAATKADGSGYYFSTIAEDMDVVVIATGFISGSNITINVGYQMKYNLIGKWTFGTSATTKMPDVYFKLNTSAESINIGGDDVEISKIVTYATKLPISDIEFTNTGYFNLHSARTGFADTLNKVFNNKFEFYSDATYIYFNIKKSMIDELNAKISKTGITIPSPISISVSYKLDGTNLNLEFNQNNTKMYLAILNTMLPKITYQAYIALNPDAKMTEADFNKYKAIATQALTLATADGTTYAIGANLVPVK